MHRVSSFGCRICLKDKRARRIKFSRVRHTSAYHKQTKCICYKSTTITRLFSMCSIKKIYFNYGNYCRPILSIQQPASPHVVHVDVDKEIEEYSARNFPKRAAVELHQWHPLCTYSFGARPSRSLVSSKATIFYHHPSLPRLPVK